MVLGEATSRRGEAGAVRGAQLGSSTRGGQQGEGGVRPPAVAARPRGAAAAGGWRGDSGAAGTGQATSKRAGQQGDGGVRAGRGPSEVLVANELATLLLLLVTGNAVLARLQLRMGRGEAGGAEAEGLIRADSKTATRGEGAPGLATARAAAAEHAQSNFWTGSLVLLSQDLIVPSRTQAVEREASLTHRRLTPGDANWGPVSVLTTGDLARNTWVSLGRASLQTSICSAASTSFPRFTLGQLLARGVDCDRAGCSRSHLCCNPSATQSRLAASGSNARRKKSQQLAVNPGAASGGHFLWMSSSNRRCFSFVAWRGSTFVRFVAPGPR